MIASSVASIVAMNKGSMLSFGNIEARHPSRIRRARVGHGEGDHQVAGVVMAATADESQPQRRAPREPLELVRQQGRIGRDDDDNRARPTGVSDLAASPHRGSASRSHSRFGGASAS